MSKDKHSPYRVLISRKWRRLAACAAVLAAGLCGPAAAAGPAAGDVWVYRLVNAYNQETLGQLQQEVSRVEGGSAAVFVTPDTPDGGVQRTEVYTLDGNWLRVPLESHGVPVEYRFSAEFPAYAFPLDGGKSWSLRVGASAEGARRSRSVRVDGQVLGTERIRVPAGEFDTVKVRRIVYPDDADFNITQTRIVETDWYAPKLARSVRTERRSDWLDLRQCAMGTGCDFRGAWTVTELVSMKSAGK